MTAPQHLSGKKPVQQKHSPERSDDVLWHHRCELFYGRLHKIDQHNGKQPPCQRKGQRDPAVHMAGQMAVIPEEDTPGLFVVPGEEILRSGGRQCGGRKEEEWAGLHFCRQQQNPHRSHAVDGAQGQKQHTLAVLFCAAGDSGKYNFQQKAHSGIKEKIPNQFHVAPPVC